MEPEFLDKKEIDKKMKEKESFHVCCLYEKGMPLGATLPDGRDVKFEIRKCKFCKRKILITKNTAPKKSNTICSECFIKKADEIEKKSGEMEIVMNKEDEELYEMAMDKFLERLAEDVVDSSEVYGG